MIPRYQSEAMNKIWSDPAKFACWFEVEIAHLEAQNRDANLVAELKNKQNFINWDTFALKVNTYEAYLKHDVIAFLRALEDELGNSAQKLHRGLTSSDIVDTAFALQLKKAALHLQNQLRLLIDSLWQKAQESRTRLCLGRTHGQAAQASTFGIKLLGHLCALVRGHKGLIKATHEISVGKLSGAVGTYAYSDCEIEKKALEYLKLRPETVATQIVARDRHAQFFSCLAIIAGSLERLALELRLLMHEGVGEASEPFFKDQQGSSAMPHKKNPILCENISGLSRLIRSYLFAILENQALWHERDISHSSVERVVSLDATSLMDFILTRMRIIIDNLKLDYERMNENLMKAGLNILSQGVLIALIDKGLKRSEAYEIVQKAALKNINFKTALKELNINKWLSKEELELILKEPKIITSENILFDRVKQLLSYDFC